MNKIKMTANILFAGIGCQEYGIKNTEVFDLEVKATSEIDTNAVISYAAIHNGLTPELIANYSEYPDRTEMAKDLERLNIGYDFKKEKPYDWQKLAGRAEKPTDLLRTTWLPASGSYKGRRRKVYRSWSKQLSAVPSGWQRNRKRMR